jgi:23S rRNA U2552 (ribose-2'-O)-methylase RlmE/FtsJ
MNYIISFPQKAKSQQLKAKSPFKYMEIDKAAKKT